MRLTPVAIALFLTVGCAAVPSRTAVSVDAGMVSAKPEVALYPFWTSRQMNSTPSSPAEAPHPAASAVLIAPGYLLAPMRGMDRLSESFGDDPSVWIFDGEKWRSGRYVNFDRETGLALIRADVPGAPVRLHPRADGLPRILAIPVEGRSFMPAKISSRLCRPTESFPAAARKSSIPPGLCSADLDSYLHGAVILDESGGLLGMVCGEPGETSKGAADADDIRSFLENYFNSWGRDVEPKPAF